MYNLDVKLYEIILKYGIYDVNEELKKHLLSIKYLRELFHRNDFDQIAIWGAGDNTKRLLNYLADEDKKKIKVILDKSANGEALQGYPVVLPEQLPEGIKYLVISSNAFRYEILSDAQLYGINAEIIELYDYLGTKGLHFTGGFFDCRPGYKDIYVDQYYYKKRGDIKTLLNLIAKYVAIRDFRNAFELIEILKETGYPDIQRYEYFKNELEGVVSEVGKSIDQENMVIFWLDSLRRDESWQMPFLTECEKRGIIFENAFANGVHTRTAFKVLMSGEYLFEHENFIKDYGRIAEESVLIRELKQRGYGFTILTERESIWGELNEENPFFDTPVPCSIVMWRALNIFAEISKPMCVLLHFPSESHPPYYSGVNNIMLQPDGDNGTQIRAWFGGDKHLRKLYLEQIRSGIEYLDGQLEWYDPWFTNVRNKIYMSDHGDMRGEIPPNIDGRSHVYLMLDDGSGIERRNDDVIEMKNYHRLVEMMIDRTLSAENVSSISSECAIVQEDDVYNKRWLSYLVSLPYAQQYVREMMQFIGVVTKEDSYLLFATGREYYHIKKGGRYIPAEDDERKKALRKVVENKFVNSYKYPKTEHAGMGYKYIEEEPIMFNTLEKGQ